MAVAGRLGAEMGSTFALDLFYETDQDEVFAEQVSEGLQKAVGRVAAHVSLVIEHKLATQIEPWDVPWNGQIVHAIKHLPSDASRQSLLIANRYLVAQGFGTPGYCVVSKPRMEGKASAGGDPADISIHEWIHTIEGAVINGRVVPFADDAEKLAFVGAPGPDGELRWDSWFRYALGGSDESQPRGSDTADDAAPDQSD
jgi:hypothetical protein